MNKRHVLALDLQDDPALIAEYEKYHRQLPPEIRESFFQAGIVDMEIYRWQDRLFMILEVDETFSFERKETLDANNHKVQEWERLMWEFQKPLPGTPPGEKWQLLNRIYTLKN